MATLDYARDDYEDGDEDGRAVFREQALTWKWETWPPNLRQALIFTISLLVLIAAALGLIYWADKDIAKQLSTQNNLKAEAQLKLKNSDKERSDIVRHLPLLRELEANGIFGEEKRLEWVELLRSIEKRWPGISIKYDITAQTMLTQKATTEATPIPTAPSTAPSMLAAMMSASPSKTTATASSPDTLPKKFGVFTTTMKLTLKVLHEGDVLAVLAELKAAKLGRFDVNQCSFKRTAQSPTIDADCSLTWISMKPYTP